MCKNDIMKAVLWGIFVTSIVLTAPLFTVISLVPFVMAIHDMLWYKENFCTALSEYVDVFMDAADETINLYIHMIKTVEF